MITFKSNYEVAKMEQAGVLLCEAMRAVLCAVRPGVSTLQLDQIAHDYIKNKNAVPSFLGYRGFPASICASINDEVVHGIPNANRVLEEGDIISIDMGVILNGYHADMARTVGVGRISEQAKQLIEVTKQSFFEGIQNAVEGNRVVDIGAAVQKYVEAHGFSVVRDLVGHGIGTSLHEEPDVPNFKTRARGARLMRGMTLAIEPMINAGNYRVVWDEDEWTVRTADESLSAHYENTILITDGQPRLLTVLNEEECI